MLVLRTLLVILIIKLVSAKCDLRKIFHVPHEKDKLQILERSNFDSPEPQKQQQIGGYPQHNKPHAVANAQVLLQLPEIGSRNKEVSHVPYYILPPGQKQEGCNLEKVLVPTAYLPVMTCSNSKAVHPIIHPRYPWTSETNKISKIPASDNSGLKQSEKNAWDAWIKAMQTSLPKLGKKHGISDSMNNDVQSKPTSKQDEKILSTLSEKDLADIIALGKALLGSLEKPQVTIPPTTPRPHGFSEDQSGDMQVLEILPKLIKSLQDIGTPGFSKTEVDNALAIIDDFVKRKKGSIEAVYPTNAIIFNTNTLGEVPGVNAPNTTGNGNNGVNVNITVGNGNPNPTNGGVTETPSSTQQPVNNEVTTTQNPFAGLTNIVTEENVPVTEDPSNTGGNNETPEEGQNENRMMNLSPKFKSKSPNDEVNEIRKNLLDLSKLVKKLVDVKDVPNDKHKYDISDRQLSLNLPLGINANVDVGNQPNNPQGGLNVDANVPGVLDANVNLLGNQQNPNSNSNPNNIIPGLNTPPLLDVNANVLGNQPTNPNSNGINIDTNLPPIVDANVNLLGNQQPTNGNTDPNVIRAILNLLNPTPTVTPNQPANPNTNGINVNLPPIVDANVNLLGNQQPTNDNADPNVIRAILNLLGNPTNPTNGINVNANLPPIVDANVNLLGNQQPVNGNTDPNVIRALLTLLGNPTNTPGVPPILNADINLLGQNQPTNPNNLIPGLNLPPGVDINILASILGNQQNPNGNNGINLNLPPVVDANVNLLPGILNPNLPGVLNPILNITNGNGPQDSPIDAPNNATLANLLILLNSGTPSSPVSRANLENLIKFLEDYLRLKTIASLIDPSFIFPNLPQPAPSKNNSTINISVTVPNNTLPETPNPINNTTVPLDSPPTEPIDCGNPIIAEIGTCGICSNVIRKPNVINITKSHNWHITSFDSSKPPSHQTHQTHFTGSHSSQASKSHINTCSHLPSRPISPPTPPPPPPSNFVFPTPSSSSCSSGSQHQIVQTSEHRPPIYEEVKNGYVCPKCVQQSQIAAHAIQKDIQSTNYYNKKTDPGKLVLYDPCEDEDQSYEAVEIQSRVDFRDNDKKTKTYEKKHRGSYTPYTRELNY